MGTSGTCESFKRTNFYFSFLAKDNYIRQLLLIDRPMYISKDEEIYIRKQMKYCICKLECENHSGTGFFLKIHDSPENEYYLPVLITSNKILGKNEISNGNYIKIFVDDEKYFFTIIIDDSRLTFIDESYGITVVELKEENLPICALEIDPEVFKSESIKEFNQKTVYLIFYPETIYSDYSLGVIKSISLDGYFIKHTCKNPLLALGCPIINLKTFKVIGIHKQNQNNTNIFYGIFIKGLIQNFFRRKILYNNRIIMKTIEELEKEEDIEIIQEHSKCVLFRDFSPELTFGIPCKGNTIFSDVENLFYDKYPQYKNACIKFIKDGKEIKRNLTVDQNECGDGLPVIINKQENISENYHNYNLNPFQMVNLFNQFEINDYYE